MPKYLFIQYKRSTHVESLIIIIINGATTLILKALDILKTGKNLLLIF